MDPDLQEGLYDNFSELFAEGLVSVRNPDPMDIATAKYASGIISEEELMVIRRVHETAMKLSPSKDWASGATETPIPMPEIHGGNNGGKCRFEAVSENSVRIRSCARPTIEQKAQLLVSASIRQSYPAAAPSGESQPVKQARSSTIGLAEESVIAAKQIISSDSGPAVINEYGVISGGNSACSALTKKEVPSEMRAPNRSDEDDDIDLSVLELDIAQIETGVPIGSGEFGNVCKGVLHGTGVHTGMKALVAIKTLKEGSDCRSFLVEARMTASLRHPNIVNVYGVVTTTKPILVVLELCELGCIKSFMQKPKAKSMKLGMVITMIRECGEGMAYVSKENVVHRDLAARNVLLQDFGGSQRCKISDFGLAVELEEPNGMFQGDTTKVVPVRWTAPEAIKYGHYSTKSDVWAFGVLAYEIITFGKEPYEGASNKDVINMVCFDNIRLPCPEKPCAPLGCPASLHSVMIECWNIVPSERPSFDTAVALIDAIKLV